MKKVACEDCAFMRMAVSHLGTTTLQYMSCYRYPEPTKVTPQHWCGEFKEREQ